MSELARAEFDNARILQTTQNDAGRIRRGVVAAQQRPVRAGIRWPFELMQNAHDAGPRDGDQRVEINFVLHDDRLVVSHTGKPFVAQELAALLSGGSSKEFDSDETTGRFGTGFLVTHALSTRVDVSGVLTTKDGPESFHIELMRDGDEESIVKNIEQANQSLENAESVSESWIASNPTASFIYHNPNSEVARRGLGRLEQTLPYLYATCSKLGRVSVEQLGNVLLFEPDALSESMKDDFLISETCVTISSFGSKRQVIAVRIGRKGGQSALLAVLEKCDVDKYQLVLPGEGFARVFVTFPIAETDFLPFNVVVDGNFAPDQERDGIAMDDGDKALMSDALAAFPKLVQYAMASGWRDAHELARIAIPDRPLSGEIESGEMAWWKDAVLSSAEETAAMPIVQTEAGLLPALHSQDRQAVSFMTPAIDADAVERVDYDTVHEIANAIIDLNLPDEEVARSWGEIARQWYNVGVSVERLGFDELTVWLKGRAESVSDLPVQGDHFAWLAKLFLLAADIDDQNVQNMVNGLLPDQYGQFRNTRTEFLYRDAGIPAEIKDIADTIGEDLRERLLHDSMANALMATGYEAANDLVGELLDNFDGHDYTEHEAIEMILEAFEKKLPDDSQFDEDTGLSTLRASARLASYLAENDDVPRIRKCPLLTAAGRLVYLTGSGEQILAPSLYWPETERPYAELYTENRLLSDRYCDGDVLADALNQLISSGLVIDAPLYVGRRAELADVNLLREMADGEQDTAGVTVRNENFGQIAFLATDLVNRCGQNEHLAELLLDFVLNVAASQDQSWRNIVRVTGSRSGEQVNLSLHGAIWPFELKLRPWIPVERVGEDGTASIVPMAANEEAYLRGILDSSWLKNNRDARDLLHQFFGFQQLTLALDTLDDETKNDLVELLQDPELVKVAANNPDAVKFASELESADIPLDSVRELVRDMKNDEGLVEHLANRREQMRRVHANQDLGFSVEDLVRENLEQAGFSVSRTGVGSDFVIAAEVGDLANLRLTKGDQSWLVEVKATREQKVVRMTDTQAKTAVMESGRFLLCVVPVEPGSKGPEVADVRASMRFVSDIGTRAASLCNDLGDFEDMRDEITADGSSGVQLEIVPGPARLRVASSVWENDGFPLDDLAKHLSLR